MNTIITVLAFAMLQQQAPNPLNVAMGLDRDGKHKEARALIQQVIDTATAPNVKATAQRTMARSLGFDGDCKGTIKYEQMAMAYWNSREQADPQNAFYQQGELANEAARFCIDAGFIKEADYWYRKGTELGLKEPTPKTHPTSLWNYRLAHALARIAARNGDRKMAEAQIKVARAALDGDTAMARSQERFFPYLLGYVAFYLNDIKGAQQHLTHALSLPGNGEDPFMHYLLAEVHAKQGHAEVARPMYEKALALATAHNPQTAFVKREVPKKLK
jgi:tetratricopeptide (TPR) repeat protein